MALEQAARAIHAPTPGARHRLDRLVEEGGCFVTTGQQPGLFTGPLYSLYKALTAVRLAGELESILERPVLPLFWIASEDHDWTEVNHTWIVDLENRLRRIELRADVSLDSPPPIHRILLDGGAPAAGDPLGGIAGAIEELSAFLPGTEFKEECLRILRESYPPGSSLATGFRAMLEALLGDLGLLFVDAADPVLKSASLPVLERELRLGAQHEEVLVGEARRLEKEGYGVQVPILPEGLNLFLDGSEGRERLYRSGDGFRLRRSGKEIPRREVERVLIDEPGRLSPNVLLRPVVENHVFPVVSCVVGPGELAYYAQLGAFFRTNELELPVIHPRAAVTLIESKIGKVLQKFGVDLPDLARPHHELAGDLLREEMPPEVRRALGELRGSLGSGVGKLLSESRKIDPTLKGPVEQLRSVTLSAVDDVEKKIVQSLKRENEISLSQLEKAQLHLYPMGKPQERVLNPFYYLARYGSELISAIVRRIEIGVEARSRPGVG